LDQARANRLAEAIKDDGVKAYALGMMALGLSEAGKKDSARSVLESAYASLERSSSGSQSKPNSIYHVASVAGALLSVAEEIDPGLVDEYLWRSLAMRQPKPWDAKPGDPSAYVDVLLAMMLARYDRAIARALVEPLVRGGGSDAPYVSNRGELYAALAAIDPKWGVEVVEAMPDDPDLKPHNPKNSARIAVATVLGRAGTGRFRKLQGSFLFLWLPDVEDVNPYD
jgi:hypothetical protein